MLCFAYGSNMSIRRLQARVPESRFLSVAWLHQHRLVFHKRSREDGSAKCDAFHTGDPGDWVVGVVYDIPDREKPVLDRIEGLGNGYDEALIQPRTPQGELLKARMYAATDVDPALTPFSWYRAHVLIGAHENGFPTDYVERILETPVQPDPDVTRNRNELAIYPEAVLPHGAVA
ncbi:gamma-glutamylcyclotransferase family protein [Halomonadaceae bacterium KBTZ08]